jgi:hypothetical protein
VYMVYDKSLINPYLLGIDGAKIIRETIEENI